MRSFQFRARRVDENQDTIVRAAERAGAVVCSIGHPVDLLVYYRGHTLLWDVKRDPSSRPTDAQLTFCEFWPGRVSFVRTTGDVRRALREAEREGARAKPVEPRDRRAR